MISEDPESIGILHVDDDPDFADLAANLLEREDDRFTVETATTASAGLDLLAAEPFDCVVSDYQMPGMDGVEFLEAVREDHPDLPFFLFTGKGSEEVAGEAISMGATDYLQKGSDTELYELLANRVRNAVEQYRASKQAANLERIRTLITEINQALVRAGSRDELEGRVCAILSDADPYVFAWIGEYDAATESVEPRAVAGLEDGYLEAVEITADDSPTGQGPTGRAIRTGAVTVQQNIRENDDYEPWREDALERGYRSSAAVPLVYDGTTYGVLNLYADRAEAFDADERQLLEELGDDLAHGINAQEVQRERSEQIARLEALFEESPDMINVHDADGRIVDANPLLCEKLGYEREDLVGKRIWEIDLAADAEESPTLLDGLDPGDRLQTEGEFRRADGSTFPVEIHVRRLDLAGGERFLVISRDVTEQHEREERLKDQAGRLEEFTEAVSHDLRNPLSTANGYLELVREDVDHDHLDAAAANLDRMERIIEDVLWLARQGQQIGETEAVDLREALEASWRVVAGAELEAELDMGADLGTVVADYDRFRQLLENVLGNAVKHGGSEVRVRVEPLADGFAIADDGPGIPAERRETVFDHGVTTDDEGTGYGLSIVQEIANGHGWSVHVTESESGGARFVVTGIEREA